MDLSVSVILFGLKALLTVALGVGIAFATKFNPFAAMGIAVFLADVAMVIFVSDDDEEEKPTV